MKKRIISLFCILTLLLPSLPTAFASTYEDVPTDTNESRIIEIITKLGIMVGYEDGSFRPENAVTRAEFVTVIRNSVSALNNITLNSDDEYSDLLDTGGFNWIHYFLGDGYKELELMYPSNSGDSEEGEVIKNTLWSDVSEEHWAYENMKAVSILGCIHGYPDGTFRPDNPVSYNEGVKIILSLCGYDDYAQSTGGFPDGYTKLAGRFGLAKSVSATGSEPLSRMDVATLIYNAFKLELVSPLIDESEERNFLNDIVGVYTLEGTLEGTDTTTIYSSEGLKNGMAQVAGTEFIMDTDSDIRDSIGREVRVFLRKIDDEYVMLTYEEVSGEDVTVIDIDLFENFASNTFYYKTSKDSDKEKGVKVRVGSKLIFNGEYVGSYDASTFENLNKGTITIIEKDEYDFDIIVVENFESGYAQTINLNSMEITDLLKAETAGDALITLKNDDANEIFIYEIIDENGNEIALEDMKIGAVNYYRGPNVAKIITSSKTVSGQVTGSSIQDDERIITVGGKQYTLSKTYNEYIGDKLRIGVEMQIYLDSYNEAVWMSDNVSMEGYAYLAKVLKDDENAQLKLRFYDIDNKSINEAYTAEVVRYTDKYAAISKYEYNNLYNEIKDYVGIVKLSYNEEGVINKLAMPLAKTEESGSTLKEVLNGSYMYMSGSYGGKYYIDSNTVILNVPSDSEEYDDYSVIAQKDITSKTGASNSAAKSVILYNFDDESPFAKLAVTYKPKTDKTSVSRATMYYVMKIIDSIDDNNDPIKEMIAFNFSSGEQVTLRAKVEIENGVETSAFDTPLNAYEANYGKPVEKGDIINIAVDSNDADMVGVAVLLYDANEVNPAWCMPENSSLGTSRPIECPDGHTHKTSILGTIPGTHGFAKTAWELDSSNSTTASIEVNPFQYGSYGIYHYSLDGRYHRIPGNQWSQFTLGFVYANKEGLLRVTTQNLREGFDGTEDENYSWVFENPTTRNAKVYIVEDGAVKPGSISDIRTYKTVGSRCDKVFTYGSQGLQRVVVLRD